MQGNKGQHGKQWIGMRVNTKRGVCTIVYVMTDEEYRESGEDYTKYFTLQDSQENTFQCERGYFKVPRK